MKNLTFKEAFNYPFNRAKGMLNILWILVPIIGWLALIGYTVRIVQEFTKGKYKKLPLFKFKKDLKLGFFMFLKSLPFILIYIIIIGIFNAITPWLDIAEHLINLFILPILTINFVKKMTVSSYFEFKIIKYVFNNFGDYIIILLKSILLSLIFFIMIIVLVGLPAGAFTKNMFIADFNRRRVK